MGNVLSYSGISTKIRAMQSRLIDEQQLQEIISLPNVGQVIAYLKKTPEYAQAWSSLDENELHLTPIEYKLLYLLSKNVGKVLTHTFITQNIWGRSWDNDVASLRVFMATLRKKLEPTEESPQYIQTHIGVGYRMMKIE